VIPKKGTESGGSGGGGGAQPNAKRLVRKAEVCEMLGVSPSLIDRLIQEARIPLVRIGRTVRFDPDEVLSWFKTTPPRNRSQK